MKIAYCYPESLPSSMARSIQTINTCAALSNEVENVFFYLPAGNYDRTTMFSYYNINRPNNLKIRFLKKKIGPVSSNSFFNLSLKLALKRDKPDILITRHLKTAAALTGFPAPLIFEAHEIFSNKKQSAKQNMAIEKRVMFAVQGVMCLTKGLKNAIKNSFQTSGYFSIVPSGTRVRKIMPDKASNCKKKFRITYVGTSRYNWKGLDTLLKAMIFLPESIYLEIVGNLDKEYKTKKICSQLIDQNRLKTIGHLPHNEAIARLEKADVAVIPNSGREPIGSLYTSPLKLLEAMAAGTAIVASDLPSIREVVSKNQAILVSPDDPYALTEGILKLYDNPKLRLQLPKNAWIKVQDFSWENRAKKIVKFADEVLKRVPV